MHTQKFVLTACLLILMAGLRAQNQVTDSTATVITYWQKGDKARFDLKQTREKYRNDKLEKKSISTSTVDLLVTGANDTSYKMQWTYSNIKIDDPDENNPLVLKLAKLSEGLTVKYMISEMGAFKKLLNWKEIQAHIYKAIDKIGAELDPAERASLKHVKALYSTYESIEQLAIRDIQLYHTVYGGEYKLHEKLSMDAYVPNFFGENEEPFPATLSVEMTELKPENKYCKIQVLQEVDSTRVSQVIYKWTEKLKQEKAPEELPAIKINDLNEFEVELISGWLTRVYYERLVISGPSKSIDTTELKKM